MANTEWCRQMLPQVPEGTEARAFIEQNLSSADNDRRGTGQRVEFQTQVAMAIMKSWQNRPVISRESLKKCEEEMGVLYGMEKAKRLLLGYVASRGMTPDAPTAPLLLIGPPGVGKSTLAVAASAGFQRHPIIVALGSSVSEEQMFGTDPMWSGAGPGMIARGFQMYGRNLFFIFDEMTKIPVFKATHMLNQSNLLQVIDPLLGRHFVDRFLEYGLNLTQIPIIATGNTGDEMIDPLKDRFQVIELDDYSLEEKRVIAAKHLAPKALKKAGLEGKASFSRDLINLIVDDHSARPGVRQIERDMQFLLSMAAMQILKDGVEPPIRLRSADHKILEEFCRSDGGHKPMGFRMSA